MGLFQPNKRATFRRFSYAPRYYNPEKDDRLKRRMRVRRHVGRRKTAGFLYFALLLMLALYMYMQLG